MNKKITVGLFFGGRSVEHEVSVISALQAYKHLDKSKYDVIPIYIDKTGHFYSHPKLLDIKNYKDINALLFSATQLVPANKQSVSASKSGQGGFIEQGMFKKFKPIDVALPIFHGSFGEDGAIQGLFEIYQVPYVGLNVTNSAVAMDKAISKALFKELDLPVGKYIEVKRLDWWNDQKSCLDMITGKHNMSSLRKRNDTVKGLKGPWFVKPATGGSSIGAGKAKNEDELQFAIEVASVYSEKIMIEEAFENVIEVNCSALGYEDIRASVCEMPIPSSKDVLSFSDKYQRGGKGSKGAGGMESLTREIPAPISKKLTTLIQDATVKIFKAIDGCGVARIDYFVDPKKEKFWVNEVNSPPGSLAFYLWEKSDPALSYTELLDQLIEMALKRAENQKKTTYVFESGLLSQMAESAK
jgi:D-alanine-D-alanine ligase